MEISNIRKISKKQLRYLNFYFYGVSFGMLTNINKIHVLDGWSYDNSNIVPTAYTYYKSKKVNGSSAASFFWSYIPNGPQLRILLFENRFDQKCFFFHT